MVSYINQNRKSPAYLTVYLALTMTIMLSLCLVLIEGARKNAIRLETECVTDIGLNSTLAEYHRELFRQYNLFAIDSSYGTAHAAKENTLQHFKGYVEKNLSTEDIFLSDFLYRDFLAMSLQETDLTKVSLFTDDKGAVFRRQAVDAVKEDTGLAVLEDLKKWMEVVDAQELDTRDIAAEKQKIDDQMEEIIEEEEEALQREAEANAKEGEEVEEVDIPFENPTKGLEDKRKEGILKMTVDDPDHLSTRTLPLETLIMNRMEQGNVNRGNFSLEEVSWAEQLLERFLFQEYLLRYMGHYGKEDESAAIWYQAEYLIVGKECDVDNLRSVANRLCLMREAANAVYLFSDEVKCAEAELLATLIAALIRVPDIAPLLKVSLLLGWAYAESLYDVETLLSGGKIPLMKDEETWHYSLQGALQAETKDGGQSEGLSYEDYLRIFMMLTDLDTLTGRAMNVIEADIRQTPGNRYFRMDGCYDRIEIFMQIKSAYGYECEITRQKGYR